MPTQTFMKLKNPKKQRIIDAALNEFARHDFSHINIQNIVKEANISRGSFYQYFDDLNDLFDYLIQMIAIDKKTYLNQHGLLDDKAPFFDRIGELYRLGYQYALDHPKIFHASKHMMYHMKQHQSELLMKHQDDMTTYYKTSILYDISQGRIRTDIDIDMLINVLQLFLDELLQTHFIEQRFSQTEVDKRFKRFITLLKKGIESHV